MKDKFLLGKLTDVLAMLPFPSELLEKVRLVYGFSPNENSRCPSFFFLIVVQSLFRLFLSSIFIAACLIALLLSSSRGIKFFVMAESKTTNPPSLFETHSLSSFLRSSSTVEPQHILAVVRRFLV